MRHLSFTRNLIVLLCFFLVSGCAATETTTKPDTTGPAPSTAGGDGTETVIRPATTTKPELLYVLPDRLNLRECPSIKCKVAAVLKRGDEVIKLGQEKDWVNVRARVTNREGWVASTLVGKTAPKKKPFPRIKEQSPPQGKDEQGSSELQEEFAP
jgi:uncharacterized protein YgiM (DUF1202 family)